MCVSFSSPHRGRTPSPLLWGEEGKAGRQEPYNDGCRVERLSSYQAAWAIAAAKSSSAHCSCPDSVNSTVTTLPFRQVILYILPSDESQGSFDIVQLIKITPALHIPTRLIREHVSLRLVTQSALLTLQWWILSTIIKKAAVSALPTMQKVWALSVHRDKTSCVLPCSELPPHAWDVKTPAFGLTIN